MYIFDTEHFLPQVNHDNLFWTHLSKKGKKRFDKMDEILFEYAILTFKSFCHAIFFFFILIYTEKQTRKRKNKKKMKKISRCQNRDKANFLFKQKYFSLAYDWASKIQKVFNLNGRTIIRIHTLAAHIKWIHWV